MKSVPVYSGYVGTHVTQLYGPLRAVGTRVRPLTTVYHVVVPKVALLPHLLATHRAPVPHKWRVWGRVHQVIKGR